MKMAARWRKTLRQKEVWKLPCSVLQNKDNNEEEVTKTFEELFKDKQLLSSEFFVVPEKKVIVKEEEEDKKEENKEDEDDSSVDGKVMKTDEKETEDETNEEENEKEEIISGRVEAWPALQKKLIGLYFSAGWCPPCRQFTPLLKDFHEETQRRSAPFEVVFISCDKKEEDMISYYRESHGEWLVVPFADSLRDDLKARFNITAVPKLIIVNSSGDVITMKGRKEIQDKGIICFRTWQEIATFRENRARSQASAAPAGDTKEEEGDKSAPA